MSLHEIFSTIIPRAAAAAPNWCALGDEALAIDATGNPAPAAQVAAWWQRVARAWTETQPIATLNRAQVARLVDYDRQLADDAPARKTLLPLIGAFADPGALDLFAAVITARPPADATDLLLAMAPLFRRKDLSAEALFPRLFDGLSNPVLATAVLDLANFMTRSGRVARHPAAGRVTQLAGLLGELVQRLRRVEERPQDYSSSARELTLLVGDSVSLIVALCNALALIGEPSVTGKLHQAMELAHRNVRCEAAGALAQLGDEAGVAMLVELAAHPLVRSRVLSQLETLNLLDKVNERYRTTAARAEGDLVAWLAQPTRFGVPPAKTELIDASLQAWPGYNEPVDCFLFEVEYRIGEQSVAAIAIAGPHCDVVTADLEDLPPRDIYALYMGRVAEHPEISTTPADQLSEHDRADWTTMATRLSAAGYTDVELAERGNFFGATHWVATARRDDRRGVVICTADDDHWFALPASRRPPGAKEFYWLYKGRLLQEHFERRK